MSRYAEFDEEIVSLYEIGMSIREIAKKIHWSRNFVRNRLIANGVELRKRGGNRRISNALLRKRIVFLYLMGYSMKDTAILLKISRNCVRNNLAAARIPARPRGGAGQKLVTRRATP